MFNTNSVPVSPFTEKRREKESPKTALYVNYKDYRTWSSLNNCVIEGTRGTGKTTILTILNYETRWLNKTRIVPSDELTPFFTSLPNFIGIYFRCEEIEKALWNRWLKRYDDTKRNDENEINSQILFATFLNYFFIEKIIKALLEITQKHTEYYSDNDKITDIINEVIHLCYPSISMKPSLYDFSLNSLRNALKTTMHDLRQQVYSLVRFEDISSRFCLHTGASCVIAQVCKVIQRNLSSLESVNYFLLLDDVDRLDAWQLEVVNSFISSSEEPISIKLTCTGDYRIKINTNNRSISTTDLFISKLNDDEDPSNKKDNINIDELFTAIFNIRLDSKNLDTSNKLELIFGQTFNIEEVFKKILLTSTNPEVKKLLNDFEGNNLYDKLSDYWIDKNKFDTRYNKVLIKEQNMDEDNINHKYYNKYRTSAVFSAINQFNLEESFTYYSFDIIKMVSSGSPRHFLRICDKIWPTIFNSISSNDKKYPIDYNIQSNSIKEVAQDVYENIEDDQFSGEIKISCRTMCDRLGKLFKKFISTESIRKSPECLSVLIDLSKLNSTDSEKLIEILDRLRMFEAIKTRRESDTNIKVALAPMLTPCFCLPFRSPFSYYYTFPTPSVFLRLLTSDDLEANNLIDNIYSDRIGQKQHPNLFSNE